MKPLDQIMQFMNKFSSNLPKGGGRTTLESFILLERIPFNKPFVWYTVSDSKTDYYILAIPRKTKKELLCQNEKG